MNHRDDREQRALQALAREAAEEPVPELDWQKLEKRLMASIEQPATLQGLSNLSSRPHRPKPAGWSFGLVAAAAVVIVGVMQLRGGSSETAELSKGRDTSATLGSSAGSLAVPTPSEAPSTAASSTMVARASASEGDLREGDVVESGADEIKIHREGVADLVLSPHSRLRVAGLDVLDGNPSMTVTLLVGTVRAEVVPHVHGEVFAVEVEHTRVAVHGTAFSVTREGDRIAVDVSHGSVAVGPTGHRGSTQGWLMVGPESGSFSLDGGSDARWASGFADPNHAVVGAGAVSPRGPVKPHAASARVVTAGALPEAGKAQAEGTAPGANATENAEVNRADQERAATRSILAGIEACYARQVSSFGVHFTVESSLALTISPTGAVREGIFDPPLSPTLMTCARDAVLAAHYPAAPGSRQVRVPVRLTPP